MKAMPGATLLTIGYEGLTPSELASLLRKHGATRVADVRQLPLSRKRGFSKSELAATLTANCIEYVGFPELGTPPAVRNRYKQSGDFFRLKQDYLAYLSTQGAAVESLHHLVAQGGCCLLCFERDAAQCHRSVLAEAIAARNGPALQVKHIQSREGHATEDGLFARNRSASSPHA
jgi:uncharacterized protein (DUF488 family)